MTKEYICECGRKFDKPQSFNGHKSGCKVHSIAKYGSLDVLQARYKNVANKCSVTNKNIAEMRKQQQLDIWIAEQHCCECCGNIMTEKFGSGRFCSRACANSRKRSEETKRKISISLANSEAAKASAYEASLQAAAKRKEEQTKLFISYSANPSYCKVCGNIIPFARRTCLTCSVECQHQASGGFREHSGTGKSGWYKGIYCASTYELAFVIYCLDHNINIAQCKDVYSYEYKGKQHKYHPDFIINNTIIEIKGYWTDLVDIKCAAVTDKPIKVLYKADLDPVFAYIKNFYGKTVGKDLRDLYESRK